MTTGSPEDQTTGSPGGQTWFIIKTGNIFLEIKHGSNHGFTGFLRTLSKGRVRMVGNGRRGRMAMGGKDICGGFMTEINACFILTIPGNSMSFAALHYKGEAAPRGNVAVVLGSSPRVDRHHEGSSGKR